jgi:hypothetical protein
MVVSCYTALAATNPPPAVLWQRSLGGSGRDDLNCPVATPDGGVLLGGFSMSPTNQFKTALNFGPVNFWIVRLDHSGTRLWDKVYGGSDADYLESMGPTTDGGYILGGPSRSPTSGNKTAPLFNTNALDADFWIVKVDAQGNKAWDRGFGGSGDDQLYHVRQTRDGGFVLGGWSRSPANGNKSVPGFGEYDYWVVRTDPVGNKLWDRCYGGSEWDLLYSVAERPDGGFVLAGISFSGTNGNKTVAGSGPWVVAIDGGGSILWQRRFDGFPGQVAIVSTSNGEYVLACSQLDLFAYRLDSGGNILWQGRYGNNGESETPYCVIETRDAGFILGGSAGNTGDYRIFRLDSNGTQLWDLRFGGTDDDRLRWVEQTSDEGFVLAGTSRSSTNGNKTAPALGMDDYWVVKLGPDIVRLRPPLPWETSPATNTLALMLSGPPNTYVVESSDDLNTWIPFQTNQVDNVPIPVIDSGQTAASKRFYRAKSAD